MNVIILNRRNICLDIYEWTKEYDLNVFLITCKKSISKNEVDFLKNRIKNLVIIEDYCGSEVEDKIYDICNMYNISRIASTAEIDVLRASRARRKFSIPGQSLMSSSAFRDKLEMKRYAKNANISTPPFVTCEETSVVKNFFLEHKKVVLKHRLGGGSANTFIVTDLKELHFHLTENISNNTGSEWIIEKWIEGEFYTVDGIMKDGNVIHQWPSRTSANLNSVLNFSPLTSIMIRNDNPAFAPLTTSAEKIIQAFPSLEEISVFHAEFFKLFNGDILLCEIACRPGGCGHVPTYEKSFGINLYRTAILGQLGLVSSSSFNSLPSSPGLGGFVWFPPKKGTLLEIPSKCPLSFVYHYAANTEEGNQHQPPQSVSDHIASLLFHCGTHVDAYDLLSVIQQWWSTSCEWDTD